MCDKIRNILCIATETFSFLVCLNSPICYFTMLFHTDIVTACLLSAALVTHTLKTIFVSREDRESRQRCGEEIKRRANAGGDWPPVLIFPEGELDRRADRMTNRQTNK